MCGNGNRNTYTGLPTRTYESHAPVPGTKSVERIPSAVQENYIDMKREIHFNRVLAVHFDRRLHKFLVLVCYLRILLKLEAPLVIPCDNIEN